MRRGPEWVSLCLSGEGGGAPAHLGSCGDIPLARHRQRAHQLQAVPEARLHAGALACHLLNCTGLAPADLANYGRHACGDGAGALPKTLLLSDPKLPIGAGKEDFLRGV